MSVYDKAKKFYIKGRNSQVLAVLYYFEDDDEFLMHVNSLRAFPYAVPHHDLCDSEVRKWIEYSVLTPQVQLGYADMVREEYGLDPTDPAHRIKMFWMSNALNISYQCWMTENENEPYVGSVLWQLFGGES